MKFGAPVLVLVAAGAISWVVAEIKPEADKTVEKERPLALYVEEARRESVLLAIETQGEVRPKTEVSVIPEVSGRIVSVADAFVEGGVFRAGETLLQIEDTNYRLAVTRAEARVAEAKVQLEQELADAKIKAKQWQDWVQDGEPTPLALNKPQVARARASMRAAEADLEEAQLNLQRTKITMPFDGRVRERSAGIGQYVNAGADLGRVFATDMVEVRLPLTDLQLRELNLPIGFSASDAQPAPEVHLSSTLGGITHRWTGHVNRVNAAVDQQTRLVYAMAEVANPYTQTSAQGMPLAVGLFVNAAIESVTPKDAIVLPRSALRKENTVYVVNDQKKLEIREVAILSTDANRAFLLGGVLPGETVVVSPVRSPVAGLSVDPISRMADATSMRGARPHETQSR